MSIPWILWGLWKHPNEFLFKGKQGDINSLVSVVVEETDMWLQQHEVSSLGFQSVSLNKFVPEKCWSKPWDEVFKCNIHAS